MKLVTTITLFLFSFLPKISYGLREGRVSSSDTVILIETGLKAVIDKRSPAVCVLLKLSKEYRLNIDRKYSLCLEKIQLQQAPEGVYEIYLSTEKLDTNNLSSRGPFFVNVLNTYALTNKGNKKELCINVTRNLTNIADSNKFISSCFVAILFRSNGLPNKGEHIKTGKLSIQQMRLVESD